jgi:type I restriction enzyme, S subunit
MTDAVRLKWLLSESDIRAGAAAEKLPLLSVSISWGVRRREASDTTTRAASEDLSNYKVCRAGNLIINRMRAFQGALGIAGENGIVSPDYAVLQVAPEVDARWLNYFLTSEATVATMSSLVRGIGGTEAGNVRTPRLNIIDLLSMTAPLGSVTQQRAIADYLDRETARIDTLIKEQQRLIDMLRERRDAAWAVAVDQAYQSGREVDVRRVITSIVDGPFGSSLTSEHYSDEGARVIRLGNIGINEFRDADEAFISLEYADELGAHEVERNDVVVAGLGDDKMPLGRAAVVPDIGRAIVKADCYRLRPNRLVSSRYLAWVMSAPQTRSQIMLLARGATRLRLNTKVVQQVKIPVPDRDEQDALVAQSVAEASKVDALIAETERFIELAQERRSALITAAVTGQIDVREAA